jgi:beta-1,4-mannosyltransferase
MAWPRWSPSNAYTGALNDAVARSGVDVRPLNYGLKDLIKALVKPVDLLHVHWFERAFWGSSKSVVVYQVLLASLIAAAVKARGGKVVWTVHDPSPHRSPLNRRLFEGGIGWLWRIYQKFMVQKVDGIFLMSAGHKQLVTMAYPALRDVPSTLVRHPHYLGQYPDTVSKQGARKKLGIRQDAIVFAFVGSLRVYKNPDGLMRAFSQLPGDTVLLVAGASETQEQGETLRRLADCDQRIILHDCFVGDHELQLWLRSADVSVLPYRRVTNSGSAHLALSFDVPVLVPDEVVFKELEELVGDRWIKRFSGELSATHLADAIAWSREVRTRPDLSALGWDGIAEQTVRFYRSLLRVAC